MNAGESKNKANGVQFQGRKIVDKWHGIFKFGEKYQDQNTATVELSEAAKI